MIASSPDITHFWEAVGCNTARPSNIEVNLGGRRLRPSPQWRANTRGWLMASRIEWGRVYEEEVASALRLVVHYLISSGNLCLRGCVNPTSYLPLAAGASFTQLLRHKYAVQCSVLNFKSSFLVDWDSYILSILHILHIAHFAHSAVQHDQDRTKSSISGINPVEIFVDTSEKHFSPSELALFKLSIDRRSGPTESRLKMLTAVDRAVINPAFQRRLSFISG